MQFTALGGVGDQRRLKPNAFEIRCMQVNRAVASQAHTPVCWKVIVARMDLGGPRERSPDDELRAIRANLISVWYIP